MQCSNNFAQIFYAILLGPLCLLYCLLKDVFKLNQSWQDLTK